MDGRTDTRPLMFAIRYKRIQSNNALGGEFIRAMRNMTDSSC